MYNSKILSCVATYIYFINYVWFFKFLYPDWNNMQWFCLTAQKIVAAFYFKSTSQLSFLSWVFFIFDCVGIIYLEHISKMKNNGDFWA